MSESIRLEIVIPEKTLLEVEADYVTIPGQEGEIGILLGHIPLVTTLKSGVLSYIHAGKEKKIAVHWGYVEIRDNQINVLAELAELGEIIDKNRAASTENRTRDALKKQLSSNKEDQLRYAKLESKLFRSLTRQQASL